MFFALNSKSKIPLIQWDVKNHFKLLKTPVLQWLIESETILYLSLHGCKSYLRSTACTTKTAKWLCPRYFAVCCPDRTIINHICHHYMFMSDL